MLEGSPSAAGGFAHREWHIDRSKNLFFFENHGALDGVFQLADIPRPVVGQQQAAGFRADAAKDFLNLRLYQSMKNSTSGRISSMRSRSGGMKIAMIASR